MFFREDRYIFFAAILIATSQQDRQMYYHPYFPFSYDGIFVSLFPSVPSTPMELPLTSQTKDEPQTGVPDQTTLVVQECSQPPVPSKVTPKPRKVQEDSDYEMEKRDYTRRNQQLEKKFLCDLQGCKRMYSSIIALKNHQRLKHNKRVRTAHAN